MNAALPLTVEIPVSESTGYGAGMRETWQRVPAKRNRGGELLVETNSGWNRPAQWRDVREGSK